MAVYYLASLNVEDYLNVIQAALGFAYSEPRTLHPTVELTANCYHFLLPGRFGRNSTQMASPLSTISSSFQPILSVFSTSYTSLASTILKSWTSIISSIPLFGSTLSSYADIPTYSTLFLIGNSLALWPLYITCHYFDEHPSGWWFKYKINGSRRPPKKLEDAALRGGLYGRLVVGPVQEGIVYALLYRNLIKGLTVTDTPGLLELAKKIGFAVLFTDIRSCFRPLGDRVAY